MVHAGYSELSEAWRLRLLCWGESVVLDTVDPHCFLVDSLGVARAGTPVRGLRRALVSICSADRESELPSFFDTVGGRLWGLQHHSDLGTVATTGSCKTLAAFGGTLWPMNERKALLAWFDSQKRDLPWRRTRDPYLVWVSEVMLQQTRVQTVVPYFESFVSRFPSVEALAEAPIDEVLAYWSGLGYYRRARQMHRAAKEIVLSGRDFPGSSSELLGLPGIGPYTAAAVASIAFNEVVPVLDGNVERVMARRLALAGNVRAKLNRETLEREAGTLLDLERPGDSNEALMELGATVCSRSGPACFNCPISSGCLAYRNFDPSDFPQARRRRQREMFRIAVVVARDNDRFLLFRRSPDSSIMAGLWELPNVQVRQEAECGIETSLNDKYRGIWRLDTGVGNLRHAITYRNIVMDVYLGRRVSDESTVTTHEAAWSNMQELGDYAVSSAVRKALDLVFLRSP